MAQRESVTEDEIDAARERGRKHLASEPLALEASYDPAGDRIMLVLDSNVLLGFPRKMLEGLRDASPEQLQRVAILGPGTAIAWDEPDVGFSVAGLLAGIFGSEHWMAELGRAGGAKRSDLKTAAARRNGQKGGRPVRKSAVPKKATITRRAAKKAVSGRTK